jgi:hypothetical protein
MSGALTQACAWHWDGALLGSLDCGERKRVNAVAIVAKTSASQRSISGEQYIEMKKNKT